MLRGESDALEILEEDEDDEDYIVDWDELMGTNLDQSESLEGTQLSQEDLLQRVSCAQGQ